MIHIGIDPNIATIGSVTIGWHAVIMCLGIATGVLLTLRLGKRAGIAEDAILTAAILAVIFGLIGARVTHVLDNLSYYSSDPVKILVFQEGGLGWYGGLIGGSLAVVVYFWIKKLPLARFADAAAFGVILGLSIGRIG